MNPTSTEHEGKIDHEHDDAQIQLHELPKTKGWLGSSALTLYQGFWSPSRIVPNIIAFQKYFQPHNQDIILASYPKSGTTWLKALLFSIVNRTRYTPSNTPLLTSNPHQLLPFFEFTLYADAKAPDLTAATPPRMFSTHIPYASLPESIKSSECRIIYICRNPLDVIVSFWHFATRDHPERGSLWTMESYIDKFCEGEQGFGPFWDHVLGYWKESLKNPEKLLFLKYEDMKEDTLVQVKRIAEFIGFPFSKEEEGKGAIVEILNLCSLRNLSDLEVNKSGKFMPNFDNKSYFRKGEVGDWINHLSSSTAERVNKVIEEKLNGSGLTFKLKI